MFGDVTKVPMALTQSIIMLVPQQQW